MAYLLLATLLAATFYFAIWVSPLNSMEKKLVVVIDPGHGGVDDGTQVSGVLEKDLTLQLAKALQLALNNRGFPVQLTRTKDETKPIRFRRAELPSTHALLISLHINHYRDPKIQRLEIYWQSPGNRLSEQLALDLYATINTPTYFSRPIHAQHDQFAILSDSAIPAVLVEAGFLSNQRERDLLRTASYQTALADDLAEGVERFFVRRFLLTEGVHLAKE